jgi:hypothetical protein
MTDWYCGVRAAAGHLVGRARRGALKRLRDVLSVHDRRNEELAEELAGE